MMRTCQKEIGHGDVKYSIITIVNNVMNCASGILEVSGEHFVKYMIV